MRLIPSMVILVLVLLAVAGLLGKSGDAVTDSSATVDEAGSERQLAALEGAAVTADAGASAPPVTTAARFIDGHGSLDIERWIRLMPADGSCSEVMRPDVASVIDVLRERYREGEVEAAVFLAATYGCDHFSDRLEYQRERMVYWAHEAAGHDLVWGYHVLAMNFMNRMLGYEPGVPKPGPLEMERLRQSWHDAAFRIYQLTGDPEDLKVMAFSYAHTFGPIFDEDRAKYWLGEWAKDAPPDEVANVGRRLIGRGQGGYRNSVLGAEFLLQAARSGRSDAYLELLEFVASCEGAMPAGGLPSARAIHAELVEVEGGSVAAAIALASALTHAGDFNGAYGVLIEAQYVQQAANPHDVDSLQTLARLAEHVRNGNALHLDDPGERACDAQSIFPQEE